MGPNNSPKPPVEVEYDTPRGRRSKQFQDGHAARRFYGAKHKAGKNPAVKAAQQPAPSKTQAPANDAAQATTGRLNAELQPASHGTSAPKHVAVYLRVSTTAQDTKSQEPDLQHWANSQDQPVKFYSDKFTGKTMDRPQWKKLEQALRLGKVSQVVVWRLDRLGRTASGLTALFDDLQQRKVNLVSLKDGLDLSNPAGRLMANVLASVAQYETEIRAERVRAGQAVARGNGKRWGGSEPGKRKKVTPTQIRAIRSMKSDGESIMAISKAVGLSRPTIYDVLRVPAQLS